MSTFALLPLDRLIWIDLGGFLCDYLRIVAEQKLCGEWNVICKEKATQEDCQAQEKEKTPTRSS